MGELEGSGDRRDHEGDARPAARPHRARRLGRAVGHAARGRGGPRSRGTCRSARRRTTRPACARGCEIANAFGLTSLQEANASEGGSRGVRGARRAGRADGAHLGVDRLSTPTRASPTCRGSKALRARVPRKALPCRRREDLRRRRHRDAHGGGARALHRLRDRPRQDQPRARRLPGAGHRARPRRASRSTSTRSATARSATRSTRSKRRRRRTASATRGTTSRTSS